MSENPAEDPFDDLGDAEVLDADADELFEEMDAPEIDEEILWETVLEDPPETQPVESEPVAGETEAVVPKDQYCEKCEHFSAPPDTACTNPGTEILELVGIDQFRVRDCPVYAQRQRAETVFPEHM
jgi:hypothetical protein